MLRAQRECTLKIKTRRDAGGAGAEKKKKKNQISWFPRLIVFSRRTAHSVVISSLVKHTGPFLTWHRPTECFLKPLDLLYVTGREPIESV